MATSELAGKALYYLAGIQYDLGQLLEAKGTLDKAFMRLEPYGSTHPHVIKVRHSIGRVLLDLGQEDAAQKHFEQGLAGAQQRYAPDHPEVAWSLNNLGLLYLQRAESGDLALECFRDALTILSRHYGGGHVEISKLLNNLGVAYRRLDLREQAAHCLGKARHNYDRTYGVSHPNLGKILCNLGVMALDEHKWDSAETFLEAARGIFRRAYGPRYTLAHPDNGSVLHNIALVCLARKRFAHAEGLLRDSLSALLATYGPRYGSEHPAVVRMLSDLEQLGPLVLPHDQQMRWGREVVPRDLDVAPKALVVA